MNNSEVMNLDQYQTLAVKTLKKDDYVRTLLHCVMGMVGEAGELIQLHHTNTEERIGEVGDCMWYAACLAYTLDLKFDIVMVAAKMYRPDKCIADVQLLIHGCAMTDLLKKTVFYGKTLDTGALTAMLHKYVNGLQRVCWNLGFAPLSVAKINIKKLEARYGGGAFDAEKAIARDYAAESLAAGIKIV